MGMGKLNKPPVRVPNVDWVDPNLPKLIRESAKRKKRSKKTVEWVDAPAVSSRKRQNVPSPYQPSPQVAPGLAEQYVIGQSVTTTVPMCLAPSRGAYDFPPLIRFFGPPESAPIPEGSILTYAGELRQEEKFFRPGGAVNVMVVKHTFITTVGRCIVHDFSHLQLV